MMAPTPSKSVAATCTTNKSQWGKFKRYTGCVSYVFIIQSMQWKSSEMCFGMNMHRLNKTKNVDFLSDSVSHAFFT